MDQASGKCSVCLQAAVDLYDSQYGSPTVAEKITRCTRISATMAVDQVRICPECLLALTYAYLFHSQYNFNQLKEQSLTLDELMLKMNELKNLKEDIKRLTKLIETQTEANDELLGGSNTVSEQSLIDEATKVLEVLKADSQKSSFVDIFEENTVEMMHDMCTLNDILTELPQSSEKIPKKRGRKRTKPLPTCGDKKPRGRPRKVKVAPPSDVPESSCEKKLNQSSPHALRIVNEVDDDDDFDFNTFSLFVSEQNSPEHCADEELESATENGVSKTKPEKEVKAEGPNFLSDKLKTPPDIFEQTESLIRSSDEIVMLENLKRAKSACHEEVFEKQQEGTAARMKEDTSKRSEGIRDDQHQLEIAKACTVGTCIEESSDFEGALRNDDEGSKEVKHRKEQEQLKIDKILDTNFRGFESSLNDHSETLKTSKETFQDQGRNPLRESEVTPTKVTESDDLKIRKKSFTIAGIRMESFNHPKYKTHKTIINQDKVPSKQPELTRPTTFEPSNLKVSESAGAPKGCKTLKQPSETTSVEFEDASKHVGQDAEVVERSSSEAFAHEKRLEDSDQKSNHSEVINKIEGCITTMLKSFIQKRSNRKFSNIDLMPCDGIDLEPSEAAKQLEGNIVNKESVGDEQQLPKEVTNEKVALEPSQQDSNLSPREDKSNSIEECQTGMVDLTEVDDSTYTTDEEEILLRNLDEGCVIEVIEQIIYDDIDDQIKTEPVEHEDVAAKVFEGEQEIETKIDNESFDQVTSESEGRCKIVDETQLEATIIIGDATKLSTDQNLISESVDETNVTSKSCSGIFEMTPIGEGDDLAKPQTTNLKNDTTSKTSNRGSQSKSNLENAPSVESNSGSQLKSKQQSALESRTDDLLQKPSNLKEAIPSRGSQSKLMQETPFISRDEASSSGSQTKSIEDVGQSKPKLQTHSKEDSPSKLRLQNFEKEAPSLKTNEEDQSKPKLHSDLNDDHSNSESHSKLEPQKPKEAPSINKGSQSTPKVQTHSNLKEDSSSVKDNIEDQSKSKPQTPCKVEEKPLSNFKENASNQLKSKQQTPSNSPNPSESESKLQTPYDLKTIENVLKTSVTIFVPEELKTIVSKTPSSKFLGNLATSGAKSSSAFDPNILNDLPTTTSITVEDLIKTCDAESFKELKATSKLVAAASSKEKRSKSLDDLKAADLRSEPSRRNTIEDVLKVSTAGFEDLKVTDLLIKPSIEDVKATSAVGKGKRNSETITTMISIREENVGISMLSLDVAACLSAKDLKGGQNFEKSFDSAESNKTVSFNEKRKVGRPTVPCSSSIKNLNDFKTDRVLGYFKAGKEGSASTFNDPTKNGSPKIVAINDNKTASPNFGKETCSIGRPRGRGRGRGRNLTKSSTRVGSKKTNEIEKRTCSSAPVAVAPKIPNRSSSIGDGIFAANRALLREKEIWSPRSVTQNFSQILISIPDETNKQFVPLYSFNVGNETPTFVQQTREARRGNKNTKVTKRVENRTRSFESNYATSLTYPTGNSEGITLFDNIERCKEIVAKNTKKKQQEAKVTGRRNTVDSQNYGKIFQTDACYATSQTSSSVKRQHVKGVAESAYATIQAHSENSDKMYATKQTYDDLCTNSRHKRPQKSVEVVKSTTGHYATTQAYDNLSNVAANKQDDQATKQPRNSTIGDRLLDEELATKQADKNVINYKIPKETVIRDNKLLNDMLETKQTDKCSIRSTVIKLAGHLSGTTANVAAQQVPAEHSTTDAHNASRCNKDVGYTTKQTNKTANYTTQQTLNENEQKQKVCDEMRKITMTVDYAYKQTLRGSYATKETDEKYSNGGDGTQQATVQTHNTSNRDHSINKTPNSDDGKATVTEHATQQAQKPGNDETKISAFVAKRRAERAEEEQRILCEYLGDNFVIANPEPDSENLRAERFLDDKFDIFCEQASELDQVARYGHLDDIISSFKEIFLP